MPKSLSTFLRNLLSRYPLRRQLILLMILVFLLLGATLFISFTKLIQTSVFKEIQMIAIEPTHSAETQGGVEANKTPNPVITLDIESMESAAILQLENRLHKTIGLTIVGVLFFSLLLAIWLSKFITSPIEKLSKSIASGMKVSTETLGGTMPNQELSDLHSAITLSLDRFEKQFESQNQFLLDVAHEFRTPVSSIRMNVDVARKKSNVSSADFLSLCSAVDRSTVRLEELIEKLKILSSTKSEFQPTLVGVRNLVSESIEILLPLSREKKVDIQNLIVSNISINTEQLFLQTIITNLVENAIMYNKPGGKVVISSNKTEEGCEIHVIDNGIGIDQDDLSKIFNRFFRVDKSRSRQTGGSGLGLSIVKSLVDRLGGRVLIKSVPNSGTEVELFIPHYQEPITPSKKQKENNEAPHY